MFVWLRQKRKGWGVAGCGSEAALRPQYTSVRYASVIAACMLLMPLCAAAQQTTPAASAGSKDHTQAGKPVKPPPPGITPKPAQAPDNQQPQAVKPDAAADNPFPEDVSRGAAARSAAPDTPDAPAAADGAGSSSSNPGSSSSSNGSSDSNSSSSNSGSSSSNTAADGSDPNAAPDIPAQQHRRRLGKPNAKDIQSGSLAGEGRAEQDVRVGRYYLSQHNYQGAYARFEEAARLDPASVEAIYGVAAAAEGLHKTDEAMENYKLYLQVAPDGEHAKFAEKSIKALAR